MRVGSEDFLFESECNGCEIGIGGNVGGTVGGILLCERSVDAFVIGDAEILDDLNIGSNDAVDPSTLLEWAADVFVFKVDVGMFEVKLENICF